jgi:hypothetical protein
MRVSLCKSSREMAKGAPCGEPSRLAPRRDPQQVFERCRHTFERMAQPDFLPQCACDFVGMRSDAGLRAWRRCDRFDSPFGAFLWRRRFWNGLPILP